jgi:hypothetical protein
MLCNRALTLVGEDVYDPCDQRLGAFRALLYQLEQLRGLHAHAADRVLHAAQHNALHQRNGLRIDARKPATEEQRL